MCKQYLIEVDRQWTTSLFESPYNAIVCMCGCVACVINKDRFPKDMRMHKVVEAVQNGMDKRDTKRLQDARHNGI